MLLDRKEEILGPEAAYGDLASLDDARRSGGRLTLAAALGARVLPLRHLLHILARLLEQNGAEDELEGLVVVGPGAGRVGVVLGFGERTVDDDLVGVGVAGLRRVIAAGLGVVALHGAAG